MQENIICRCEEITEREIREAVRAGCETVNDVKRFTRAGMGNCQSKTCYNLIMRIICEERGVSPDTIKPITQRAPVRPVSCGVLYNDDYDENELFEK